MILQSSLSPSVETVWDENYAKHNQLFGIEPSQTVTILIKAFKNIAQAKVTVADMGCGGGRDTIALALNDFDAIGVDVSKRGLELAVAEYKKLQSINKITGSAIFLHGDIETAFRNYVGTLDGITSHRTLHLMKKDEQDLFARCAAELLEPNGFLAIGTRCEKDFKPDQMEWIKGKKGISARYKDPSRKGQILNFVTEDRLRELFEKDFDILKITYGQEIERVTDQDKGHTQLIFMLAQRKMLAEDARIEPIVQRTSNQPRAALVNINAV